MLDFNHFPTPKLISVNNIELEVFEAGQQNAGKPIILCHGWPELAFSWRYQVPALVAEGYHVIIPNQRGYGSSSSPKEVEAYDIEHLSGDLVALLDHYRYDNAIFVGHDWGAMVVWGLALLHPTRVSKVINLSLPYQEHGDVPWLELMSQLLGPNNYFVHFNQQPGVADAILEENTFQFLHNLYRKDTPTPSVESGMMMINLAQSETTSGNPVMSESELDVYVSSFRASGFNGSINWYRNLDRNWHLLSDVNPVIQHQTLMIYGDRDMIPQPESLKEFVPNVQVIHLDCGHWIQQELPEETNRAILNWLNR